MSYGRPVWAEVSMSALRHNLLNIKSLLTPKTKFCAVVKADGYGHGAIAVAREAIMAGADYLGVAIIDEALHLRAAGFTQPILILGYTPTEQFSAIVAARLTQTIFTIEQAQALSAVASAAGCVALVHIKIDTGMTRIGISPDDAADFALQVSQLPNIMIEGVFTHFAVADSLDKTYTYKQFAAFTHALDSIKAKGIDIPIRHCANSATILDLPEMHLDMVRCGIILYGLASFNDLAPSIKLEPAMSLKAKIVMVKDVPAGVSIGYGCTFVTTKPSRIATLPLGYADGWNRMLSDKKARVIINGQSAEFVGRICMDQCMVDVTDISSAKEGDEVLLFGGEIPVAEVATRLNTINHEIVCVLGKRVPRVYVE